MPNLPNTKRNVPGREAQAHAGFLDQPVVIVEIRAVISTRIIADDEVHGVHELAGRGESSEDAVILSGEISDGLRAVIRRLGAQTPAPQTGVSITRRRRVIVRGREQTVSGSHSAREGNI